MVAINKTSTFAVRGQVDRAVSEVRLLPMPQWPGWVAYMIDCLEAEAAAIGAEPDEIKEMLEGIRGRLDDRLAGE